MRGYLPQEAREDDTHLHGTSGMTIEGGGANGIIRRIVEVPGAIDFRVYFGEAISGTLRRIEGQMSIVTT